MRKLSHRVTYVCDQCGGSAVALDYTVTDSDSRVPVAGLPDGWSMFVGDYGTVHLCTSNCALTWSLARYAATVDPAPRRDPWDVRVVPLTRETTERAVGDGVCLDTCGADGPRRDA